MRFVFGYGSFGYCEDEVNGVVVVGYYFVYFCNDIFNSLVF